MQFHKVSDYRRRSEKTPKNLRWHGLSAGSFPQLSPWTLPVPGRSHSMAELPCHQHVHHAYAVGHVSSRQSRIRQVPGRHPRFPEQQKEADRLWWGCNSGHIRQMENQRNVRERAVPRDFFVTSLQFRITRSTWFHRNINPVQTSDFKVVYPGFHQTLSNVLRLSF